MKWYYQYKSSGRGAETSEGEVEAGKYALSAAFAAMQKIDPILFKDKTERQLSQQIVVSAALPSCTAFLAEGWGIAVNPRPFVSNSWYRTMLQRYVRGEAMDSVDKAIDKLLESPVPGSREAQARLRRGDRRKFKDAQGNDDEGVYRGAGTIKVVGVNYLQGDDAVEITTHHSEIDEDIVFTLNAKKRTVTADSAMNSPALYLILALLEDRGDITPDDFAELSAGIG